jgi:hypothetical protein
VAASASQRYSRIMQDLTHFITQYYEHLSKGRWGYTWAMLDTKILERSGNPVINFNDYKKLVKMLSGLGVVESVRMDVYLDQEVGRDYAVGTATLKDKGGNTRVFREKWVLGTTEEFEGAKNPGVWFNQHMIPKGKQDD